MPSAQKKSYGDIVQTRARRVLRAILTEAATQGNPKKLISRWQEQPGAILTIETTLQSLMHLTNQDKESQITSANVREALEAMRDFLGILQDHRTQTKGNPKWNFTLILWDQQRIERNLAEFDALWQSRRSPQPQTKPASKSIAQSALKPSAPLPGVRLPDNYVERPEALDAVKMLLLRESEKPLVVSAIAGLGGLGKSVLAAALVIDPEVQARFADGILWVTLGQNPDLQNLLGDWIRTLDKSRESYSATTLESASRYLQTLLIEKRMLLVVDDVWNGAHVEHFRVGGAECRMLVTTREAQIEGAEYHALGLMSGEEAIALVRQKLKHQWKLEQEAEVRRFAKLLGYLPLALDLAANQVRDGLSWGELRSEFEAERRAVALEVLDSSEAWEALDEAQQRKYSLRACFNLSLRRLNEEQLRQFTWLGVLPEDVSLDVRMAKTLWDLPSLQAKKVLVVLKNRSFLTSGAETIDGEPMYRVHDLMHDTARSSIEQGRLGTSIQTLADAHAQLLERYRKQAGRWDQLPNDGYIHRHLTWHLEQAGLENEIHALMAMSDERGRNAWFEACDRIGQPAIFVQDVKRGWEIAERSYEKDRTRAIVLQCRYALITATLNSLVENLPIEMMMGFVKHGYWTADQAWAYVEQMQDENKVAEAALKLIPYLPKTIFKLVVKKVRSAQNPFRRAEMLVELAQVDLAYSSEASQLLLQLLLPTHNKHSFTEMAYVWRNRYQKILRFIAQIESVDRQQLFNAMLNVMQQIQDEFSVTEMLRFLARIDSTYFPEALEAARSIQNRSKRANVLSDLAQINPACFSEALETARSIQDKSERADMLIKLARINPACFSEALEAARLIQDTFKRADILTEKAGFISEEIQLEARLIEQYSNKYFYATALVDLAQINSVCFSEALEAARSIQDKSKRADVLSDLAQINLACFSEALEAARSIQDKSKRADILAKLAQIRNVDSTQILALVRSIQDEYAYSRALLRATLYYPNPTVDLHKAFKVALKGHETYSAFLFSDLACTDLVSSMQAVDFIQTIQSRLDCALALGEISCKDPQVLPLALQSACALENRFDRNLAIKSLINGLPLELLPELAQLVDALTDRHFQKEILSKIRERQSPHKRRSKSSLAEDLKSINSITDKVKQANELQCLLPRLPLSILPLERWNFCLHILAWHTRKDFMSDLAILYPAIVHLGGKEAVRGMVDAMREVCQQWK